MCCGAVLPGAGCPMICRRGRRLMTTSGSGGGPGSGRRATAIYASAYLWRPVARRSPRRRFWTRKRSRAHIRAVPAATEGGQKGKGRQRHVLVDTLGLVLKVLV